MATQIDFVGTGFAFPLAANPSGGTAMVSGTRNVEQAMLLVLGTAKGERPMRPEFGCGIHDYVFETVDARTLGHLELEVRMALDRWEPRVEVLDVEIDLSGAGHGELRIEIGYVLRATNDVRNLVFPFYLIPADEA